ncbi:antibiotic biosynthesis monooxygenase [Streptosporangium sp. NPDC020145]|uniref:antibiotic biosynthesis monooxygenase n=1 Tax=Streptosporangium sp. NPDC020145 TaxID=3154694 RepID=UPI00341566A6
MTRLTSARMPDVRRTDARAVFVGQRYVPTRQAAIEVLQQHVEQWSGTPWPVGVLSFSCYLSVEEDTVLTYAQCSDAAVYRPFVASLHGAANAGAVEYRLRGSVVPRGAAGTPGCMVVATFDVDGAERQDRVIDSLTDALERTRAGRSPGMLSANFHVSTDATRVLNYAEWTSDETHTAFLDSAARVTTRSVSDDIPGVRPIGFKRYHLYRGFERQA